MSDTPTDTTSTGSVANTPLGKALSGDVLGQTQQDRASLRASGLAFPAQLSAIRSQEKQDVAALGPPPRLTPDQMQHYLSAPPPPKPTSLVEEWGSPAMLLALLGSAFTRQPLTNALNAGAAVMRAYQQRDFDGAKQAQEEWKSNTDTALKLYGLQAKSYEDSLKAIRSGSGDAIKDAVANLRAMAVAYNDRPLMDMLSAGRYDMAIDREDRLQKNADELRTKTDTINAGLNKQNALYTAMGTLDTAKKAFEAAQKSGNQETIASAQKAYEDAQAAYKGAADDVKNWSEAQQAAKGGAKETGGQAAKNEETHEATSAYQKLSHGETVTYGNITITPADLKAATEGSDSLTTMPPAKQHAIERLLNKSGRPVVVGNKVQPAAEAPAAAAAATPPTAAQPAAAGHGEPVVATAPIPPAESGKAGAAAAGSIPPVPESLSGVALKGWSPKTKRWYGEDGRAYDENGHPVAR